MFHKRNFSYWYESGYKTGNTMKISVLTNPKILSAAFVMVAASSAALANGTVYLEVGSGWSQANPYQYGNGGEFTATVTGFEAAAVAAGAAGPATANSPIPLYPSTPGGYNVPAGYSSAATFSYNGGSGTVEGFETFCIEDQVDFSPGTTYNYTIGNTITQSSAGITTLTAGAAWLYEQFSLGTLAGFNYTDQAQRIVDAGILQSTLWALQGEPGDGSVPYISTPGLATSTTYGLNDNFALQDLDNNIQFGSLAGAQGTVDTFNQYGVSVLQLWDSNGGAAQDQLVYWGTPPSVPDNSTTALLIGVSLVGLALFSRRMKTSVLK